MISDQQIEEATRRGQEMLRTLPRVISARYDAATNLIHIELNQGFSISFPPARAQGISDATPEQLGEIEIRYPHFDIYFPRLDEGLWVPSLVEGRFGSKRWEADWAAAHPFDRAA